MTPVRTHDEEYMRIALEEGKDALSRGDFPVGAVL